MDWVGVVIERVSNMSLEEYFRKFIFEPLNVTEIAFFPMDEMKSRLAYLHRRKSDGSLTVSDHLLRHSLVPASDLGFCMGGCGCFGTLKDYSSRFCSYLFTVPIKKVLKINLPTRNHGRSSQQWNVYPNKATNFET